MPQRLSPEDEIRLGRIIQGKDPVAALDARNKLVMSKLGFAHHLARSVKLKHEVDRDDVFSEVVLELIKAASKWNPNHETAAFAEYAKVCIRHRIWRLLRKYRRSFQDLSDVHPDGSCSPEDVMSIYEQAEQHWPVVQALPPVHRIVFVQTLGLCDGVPRTFKALASELHLTQGMVKELYREACARVKVRGYTTSVSSP